MEVPMYRYFKGQTTEICATHITFEVGQIGYLVKVPNPYQFECNTPMTLYLHYHVREDAHELFGFSSSTSRDMFENLISVKGLGPKGALAILASSTPDEIIQALDDGNAKFFGQFPGIGPKLSQQIVLDLKGKIDFHQDARDFSNEKKNNVILALKSLGYNNNEIKQATKDLDVSDAISLSDAVKNALKRLKKN